MVVVVVVEVGVVVVVVDVVVVVKFVRLHSYIKPSVAISIYQPFSLTFPSNLKTRSDCRGLS